MVHATVWPRFLGLACLGLVVAGATLWGALAIYYSDLPGEPLRLGLAAAFALGTLGAFLLLRNRRRTLVGFAVAFAALLPWWISIAPSNQRDWQTEVAVLPYATRDGDLVTLHNIRNFDYRTEQDFVPQYDDRTFDLRELDAVDLIAVYWAGDAIAHIMVSFGFAGDHVAISIETRKEKGEAYSSIKGFFKQYELIYVVGDERDLIRVRTNYRRPEELVYLYRTRARPEAAPAPVPGVRRPDQPAEGAAGVLQYAHHQLHDRRLARWCGPSRTASRSTGGCC